MGTSEKFVTRAADEVALTIMVGLTPLPDAGA